MQPAALGFAAALALSLIAPIAPSAQAANAPCSGSKGGISHCAGPRFVCNDGSVSASKRTCSAGNAPAAPARPLMPKPKASNDCSCRTNSYCTGPRGGRYCLADNGKKSYLRD